MYAINFPFGNGKKLFLSPYSNIISKQIKKVGKL